MVLWPKGSYRPCNTPKLSVNGIYLNVSPRVPSEWTWKILIQDSLAPPSVPQKTTVTQHLCLKPTLSYHIWGLLVQGNHWKWIQLGHKVYKKDPALSTRIDLTLNTSLYVKVNVKTLPLTPTSSRPEKSEVLLKESPDTPVMKGSRGDPNTFSFLKKKLKSYPFFFFFHFFLESYHSEVEIAIYTPQGDIRSWSAQVLSKRQCFWTLLPGD